MCALRVGQARCVSGAGDWDGGKPRPCPSSSCWKSNRPTDRLTEHSESQCATHGVVRVGAACSPVSKPLSHIAVSTLRAGVNIGFAFAFAFAC